MSESDISRVTMLWPSDLKNAVRGKVGARGLTDFTIEAVRAKLEEESGSTHEPISSSSSTLAGRTSDQRPPIAPPLNPEDGPIIGDPRTILSAEPLRSSTSDLLEKLRSKAAEKGVDLSGLDLQAASDISIPSHKEMSVKTDACPSCGVAMVNGECWDCL